MRVAVNLQSNFDFWTFGTRHRDLLSRRFPDLSITEFARPDQVPGGLRSAEVYFGWRFDPEWFGIAPALKWIASPAAGTDHLPLEQAATHDVVVSRSFGFHGRPMAEHVLGLILGFARGLFSSFGRQRSELSWKHEVGNEFFDVSGAAIAIIGCGAIGHELARLASACGMKVLAVRRRPPLPSSTSENSAIFEWYDAAHVEEALVRARVVVNLLPAAPDTVAFFDARRFQAMSPGCVFINVGRGSTVDEPALLAALNSGHLGWCGLDVTLDKPPRLDNPLRHHARVVLTPKTAVFRRDYMDRAVDFFAEELDRYASGLPPRGLVATPAAPPCGLSHTRGSLCPTR